jgi:hypothetical protein
MPETPFVRQTRSDTPVGCGRSPGDFACEGVREIGPCQILLWSGLVVSIHGGASRMGPASASLSRDRKLRNVEPAAYLAVPGMVSVSMGLIARCWWCFTGSLILGAAAYMVPSPGRGVGGVWLGVGGDLPQLPA